MKCLYFLGIVSVFVACSTPETGADVSYVALSSNGIDTLAALRHHSERDSLVGEITFEFAGADHVIRGWCDGHYAAIDGGSFWLELDSLGRIFGHSTTWPGYSVVRSNNDSINDLILMAMGAASRPGHFGLRYPLPPQPKIETVQFIAVDPIDQN